MSFGEEWHLSVSVDEIEDDGLFARVDELLPGGLTVTILGEPAARTIRLEFRPDQVDALAEALAPPMGQLDAQWRTDLDPPRFGASYAVAIDVLVDEDGDSIVRIDSNDAENRQAWPLVWAIAAGLADALGEVDDEDVRVDPKTLN